jgi:peptidoglycan glycosyltransferase
LNWAARNTSFVERDSNPRLQGYDDHARVMNVKDARSGKFSYIIKRDYRELIPLFRYRFWPSYEKVRRILNRNRDLHLSVDIQLQRRIAQIMEKHIREAASTKGSAIVFDVKTGDLLASVTYPWQEALQRSFYGVETDITTERTGEALLDRPRYGVFPPGSSFKLVTTIAALRKNEANVGQKYSCIWLPDGRVGNYVRGWGRPIRDDILDRSPHGTLDLGHGLIVSCNAYFAQLGTYNVGADELLRTASLFNIRIGSPNTVERVKRFLPPTSYGQGEAVASPMQMARVAGTIANDGNIPSIGSVQEERSTRMKPQAVLAPSQARRVAQFMRGVVTSGTGRRLAEMPVPVAGKTGTAELENAPSHAWFVGYAPYGDNIKQQIAFAVLVENGSYGGKIAAPAAGEIIQATLSLGLIKPAAAASPAPRSAQPPQQKPPAAQPASPPAQPSPPPAQPPPQAVGRE